MYMNIIQCCSSQLFPATSLLSTPKLCEISFMREHDFLRETWVNKPFVYKLRKIDQLLASLTTRQLIEICWQTSGTTSTRILNITELWCQLMNEISVFLCRNCVIMNHTRSVIICTYVLAILHFVLNSYIIRSLHQKNNSLVWNKLCSRNSIQKSVNFSYTSWNHLSILHNIVDNKTNTTHRIIIDIWNTGSLIWKKNHIKIKNQNW